MRAACGSRSAGPGSAIAATLLASLPAGQQRWFDREIAALKPELFAADAGITATLGGVAASGSLLLRPSVEEPRTLSLVPPLHIALLHDSLLAAMPTTAGPRTCRAIC